MRKYFVFIIYNYLLSNTSNLKKKKKKKKLDGLVFNSKILPMHVNREKHIYICV